MPVQYALDGYADRPGLAPEGGYGTRRKACQRPRAERTARYSAARAVRRLVNTPPGERVCRREDS
jgi:hypothetical protein